MIYDTNIIINYRTRKFVILSQIYSEVYWHIVCHSGSHGTLLYRSCTYHCVIKYQATLTKSNKNFFCGVQCNGSKVLGHENFDRFGVPVWWQFFRFNDRYRVLLANKTRAVTRIAGARNTCSNLQHHCNNIPTYRSIMGR